MSWEKVRYTRSVLYEQIWSEPILKVAKSYGITNQGLAKICRRLRVPRPGLGYWQRLKHGKAVRRAPLPPLLQGAADEYTVEGWKLPDLAAGKKSDFDRAAGRERDPANRIVVPPQLAEPHRLTVLADRSLRHGRLDANGIILPRSPGRLDIRVGRSCLERALRIMDVLVKALEARAYSVSVSPGEKSQTTVQIHGEQVPLWLEEVISATEHQLTPRELKDKEKNPWRYSRPTYDYNLSGRLALKTAGFVYSGFRCTFADGEKQRLEVHPDEVSTTTAATSSTLACDGPSLAAVSPQDAGGDKDQVDLPEAE